MLHQKSRGGEEAQFDAKRGSVAAMQNKNTAASTRRILFIEIIAQILEVDQIGGV